MPETFVISDTHFFHKKIQQYEPIRLELGANIAEMNQAIVERWNSVVRPDDTVYHLGDVAFGVHVNFYALQELITLLHGHKILILGNHDRKVDALGVYIAMGFEEVHAEPIKKDGYILSHEPIPDTPVLNIHGHMHSTPHHKHEVVLSPPERYFNASIEVLPGFMPILLREILDSRGSNKPLSPNQR